MKATPLTTLLVCLGALSVPTAALASPNARTIGARVGAGAPVTTGAVSDRWTIRDGRTRVERLRVTRISPANATVTVRCQGGGCPLRSRSVRPRRGRVDLVGLFRQRRLRAGSRITVFIVAPGFTGRYVSYDIRRGAIPAPRAGCSAPGTLSAVGCPGPIGPQGAPGPAGPVGPRGDFGPSIGYFTGPGQRVNVTGIEAGPVPVAQLSFLPAGSYLVVARATAANLSGPGESVFCMVRANGVPSPVSSAAVGLSAGFTKVADISVTAPVNVAVQFNLDFACYHDQPAQTSFLEAIQLLAIRVGTLETR
jgi:hypothetical protein